jgi:hypothetical protein
MTTKKRPNEKWFMLAPDNLWQEYETPQDDSYVPKTNDLLAWSVVVVKTSSYKLLFAVKVGTQEQNTWTTLAGWEIASVQALGDHVDVILENSAMQNVHMFMHQFSEPFDTAHAKETCVEPDTLKPEAIFIDASVSNTKVASRFTKLKHAVTVLNKALQSRSKPSNTVRRKAPTEEGAGSSRPQTVRKPRAVPADSRRTSTTTTPSDSNTATPSGSRQTTPSKRGRESSVMTTEPTSPELKVPRPGEEVDAAEVQRIIDTFEEKCVHCFFMGRDFKFEVNIAQCHLAPPEMCVRAKEEDYVEWMVQAIIGGQWKDDRQTIVVMPQGQRRMPTPEMWPAISKGDFWLIDGQHSVEAAKRIQLRTFIDPHNLKERLKVWNAIVVWSDSEIVLTDISRFFNMENKKRTYQASWIRNIIASREIWEFYGKPPKERENAKDKNPKWEVGMFGSIDPNSFIHSFIHSFVTWFGSFDPNNCLIYSFHKSSSLGRSTQTIILLFQLRDL